MLAKSLSNTCKHCACSTCAKAFKETTPYPSPCNNYCENACRGLDSPTPPNTNCYTPQEPKPTYQHVSCEAYTSSGLCLNQLKALPELTHTTWFKKCSVVCCKHCPYDCTNPCEHLTPKPEATPKFKLKLTSKPFEDWSD